MSFLTTNCDRDDRDIPIEINFLKACLPSDSTTTSRVKIRNGGGLPSPAPHRERETPTLLSGLRYREG